jgi:hypothetical protein
MVHREQNHASVPNVPPSKHLQAERKHMRKAAIAGLLALCSATFAAHAQQSPAGATVIDSQPGRVSAAQIIKASAAVTAINKDTRALTLKRANGNTIEVVASPEVRNFDQIKVGDQIVVQYARALTLELKKTSGPRKTTESGGAARAKLGEQPAGAVGQRVTAVADVIDVNPTKKTITLKGMNNRVVELDVQNPEHFKVVKKGDQVEIDYAEAIAVAVEPGKASAKK